MNAHNKQHDPASPVVKQNLTTQPAAAQEAVGWQFWHEMPGGGGEWRNGSPDHVVKNHRKNTEAAGIPTRDVYAAPVAAAPADLIERCREILAWQRTGVLPGNALREYANARWPDEHDPLQIAEKETAREAFRILARAAAASTPAAPGIDPDVLARDIHHAIADAGLAPLSPTDNHTLREVIRSVIDASPKGATFPNDGNSEAQFIADGERLNCPACGGSGHVEDSPKGGSDPWRGLYAPERAPNRDEYGCFYHPDIPSWDDEREESIAPLLKAQGFDLQCVPGDFSDEAMEEGGERYWQEMREWNPEPEGDGWRLVAIYDTEDGPYSMFVKPLAQAGDAEVQP